MKVIVVGAGIVGLSTAYWLARDGHAVHVIEQNRDVGEGASYANGGQLSYHYVAPFASPGVLARMPGWLVRPDSPIKFRLPTDLGELAWMIRFLMACTDERSRNTTRTLLALAEFSRSALTAMIEQHPLEFSHRANGKIVFYSTRASFENAKCQHAIQAEFGSRQSVVTRDECFDLEPALKPASSRLSGAIYTPSEEVGDCKLLCEELQRVLEAPPYGVKFHLGKTVKSILRNDRSISGLLLDNQTVDADQYVICAGYASRRLLQPLGIALPLLPLKGYSISAPVLNQQAAPQKSITDYENRVVFARIGSILRAAGFAELSSRIASIDRKRIAFLERSVAALFPGATTMDKVEAWSGSRPATPTSVPVIGATPFRNLLVNVGQGALGFTLGAGSGRLISDIIAGRRSDVNEADFAYSD